MSRSCPKALILNCISQDLWLKKGVKRLSKTKLGEDAGKHYPQNSNAVKLERIDCVGEI